MSTEHDKQIAREAAERLAACQDEFPLSGDELETALIPHFERAITAAKQQRDEALVEMLRWGDRMRAQLEQHGSYSEGWDVISKWTHDHLDAARGVQPAAKAFHDQLRDYKVSKGYEDAPHHEGCDCLRCKPAAKQESAPAAEPVLRQLARYIVNHARPDYVDHACERCTGDKDERMPNFVCAVHLSQDILAAPSPAQEKLVATSV